MYRWFSVRVECVFFTAWSTHQLPQYRGPSYFSLHFFGRRSRAINLNRCPLECSSVRNTKELGIIPHAVVQDAGSFNLVIFFCFGFNHPFKPFIELFTDCAWKGITVWDIFSYKIACLFVHYKTNKNYGLFYFRSFDLIGENIPALNTRCFVTWLVALFSWLTIMPFDNWIAHCKANGDLNR